MAGRDLPAHLRVDAAIATVDSRQLRLFGSVGRIFAPYSEWEDYRAGIFDARVDDAAVAGARAVLRHPTLCREAMLRAVRQWPVATSVNLTNTGCNRRAWLGQAACCLECGATASATKRAWWQLSDSDRTRANACADEVMALWEAGRD